MGEETRIEKEFIEQLVTELKYTYREDIRDKEKLELNFREKFEELNYVHLTDTEFNRLKDEIISDDVYQISKHLRSKNTFFREDGTPLQYTLVDLKDWCKNEYEVINQLRINTDNSHHRYDVIILINGLPMVQIELKSSVVSPRRAMQQIVDYKNDKGSGFKNSLMCFMQLFIVSNDNDTYYFANNNDKHFKFNADEQFLPVHQWADENNDTIKTLKPFTSKFLPKCSLGEMISRYMVLVTTEQKMLVMRPYQIYAVKAIVNCIEQNRGNGYIWHTTGSGKTLTSFKASTLLKDNPDIDKCLFVVDRKDLDRQTREEFNRFQENCVEENTNTDRLVNRMLSDDYSDKVIVTTIQKLGIALDPLQKRNYEKRLHELKDKRIVFIFDECHRSQFGENHKAIREFFPNCQLFGFTGTPIFEENAVQITREGEQARYKMTEDVFENLLHSYTITNAIEDRNVLRFHVDYFKGNNETNLRLSSLTSKEKIVDNIIDKHNSVTSTRKFNAIFATASINDAIEYYELFKRKQQDLFTSEDYSLLNIACVFSPPAGLSADVKQIQDDLIQEKEDYNQDPEGKKEALISIIEDYNSQFGANHTINEFDLYYQDVQQRIKNQMYKNEDYAHINKIDIVIVVDMLLTGFDSKYLNTLYIDKNLKYHGLIQAFSRTNRVLNDSKPYGNILDYRGQHDAVDAAIELFSREKTDKECTREIWLVDPAPIVIEEYQQAINDLQEFMANEGVECTAENASNLNGDIARTKFVKLFKEVQRRKVKLDQYTDLTDEQEDFIDELMSDKECRAFRGAYLETAKRLRPFKGNRTRGESPEIENFDFEFVLFASTMIDYDYIMELLAKYQNEDSASVIWEATRDEIVSLIESSSNMMFERDDIVEYINSLGHIQGITENDIRLGYNNFKKEKNNRALIEISESHDLEYTSLKCFADNIIEVLRFDDSELTELLTPLKLGWKARTYKKIELMNDLMPLLRRMANGREIAGLSVYDDEK